MMPQIFCLLVILCTKMGFITWFFFIFVNLLVETFAEATANAADACSKEEEDNAGQDEPDTDGWSALSIHCKGAQELLRHSSVLVAVGDVLHTLVICHTLSAPKLLHKALQLFFCVIEGLVDVISSISGFTTCWNYKYLLKCISLIWSWYVWN